MKCGLVTRLIDELPLVLGSGSPRRRSVLEGLGLTFEVVVPDIEEEALPGESPDEHVVRLSAEKASAASAARGAGTVLAGDTVVVLDGRLMGKPSGPEDAVRMLRALRGRRHRVLTGLTVMRCSDGASVSGLESTWVDVRNLTDEEIDVYVAGGEPLDKAGSYGIQDCGAAVVAGVEGCFYNVVGLPVVRLCRLLEELNSTGD